ncbi:MAG: hypothetical protein KDA24_25910 [Deltaproteobacteria bacterium]|nr:hypothetical protein [Deltaproteobacteria bacterium]
MDSPASLPLVFESGVFVFDEDGALHVHLAHSADDPHPMVTHPEGRDSHLPGDLGALELTGQGGKGEVRGHFPQVPALPEGGFVLTIRNYDFVQVEGSGDVSVLVRDPAELPTWFDAGKVHRFARDGSASPALWEGSRDPAREQIDAKKAWTPPSDSTPPTSPSPGTPTTGCLGMILLVLLMAFAGCPSTPDPVIVADDDDTTANDDDATADDDDSTEPADDDDSTEPADDDDSAGDDDDDSAAGDDDDSSLTIGDICFPAINDPNVPGPDYDQYSPTVGSHCFGTNHQNITGVERVVFIGDSVTVGVPNFTIDLSSWGFPAGAGTPETAFYRNLLVDQLASQFFLNAPGQFALFRYVDLINGVALAQTDGDFSSCAKWGARNDDILMPPQQQLEVCLPEAERSKNTLVIMTSGGNDLASLTESAIAGADQSALQAEADDLVANLEAAVQWIKAPGRFPNGVHVIYGNMYEFTDGTGDTASCPAAALAGFGTPPPDPDMLAEVVIGIQEEYMRIAVANGVDMIWMLEHFCGHGWKNDDPTARCYLGPNTPRWFDLSCTHPNEAGHAQLATMFMSVVNE